MTLYQGEVQSYTLSISDPERPTNWKAWIALQGPFGVAFLYFVPPSGTLRANHKRAGMNAFDIDYWMYSYAQFIDMLRNEKPGDACPTWTSRSVARTSGATSAALARWA